MLFDMVWIILLIIFVAAFITSGKQVIGQYAAMYDEDERKRKEKERAERIKAETIKNKKRECYNECLKQLESVQYQISLMEKLYEFRPTNLEKEENIKKALTLEKQYNALCIKERKLKQKIKDLETL